MIADVLQSRLHTLADSGVRELWNAVKAKRDVSDNSRASRLTTDVDAVNTYFANISYDPGYKLENVTTYRQALAKDDLYEPLYAFEVELMLRKITKTAAGKDKIPFWVFNKCSFELADIVIHIAFDIIDHAILLEKSV